MRRIRLLLCTGLLALLVGCTTAETPVFVITASSSAAPTSSAACSSEPAYVPPKKNFLPEGTVSLTQHPEYADCTLSEAGYIDRDGVFHFFPQFPVATKENEDAAYPLLTDGTDRMRSHWISRDLVAAQRTDGTFCGISRMKSSTRFLDGLFTYGDLGKDLLARLAEWPAVVQMFPLADASTGGLYFAAQSSDGMLRALSLNTLYLPKKSPWVEQLEEIIGDRYVSSILPYQPDAPLVLFTDGTAWCSDRTIADQMAEWTDLVQITAIRGTGGRTGLVGLRSDGTIYNSSSFPISKNYSANIVRLFYNNGAGTTPMLVLQRSDGAVLDVRNQEALSVYPMMDQIVCVDEQLFGVTEHGSVMQMGRNVTQLGSFAAEWGAWATKLRDVRTVSPHDTDSVTSSEQPNLGCAWDMGCDNLRWN